MFFLGFQNGAEAVVSYTLVQRRKTTTEGVEKNNMLKLLIDRSKMLDCDIGFFVGIP